MKKYTTQSLTNNQTKKTYQESAASTVYFSRHENCEYAVDKPKFPGAAAVWVDTGVDVCCCSSSSSSFINQG